MSEKGHLEVTLDGNQTGFQQMLNSARVEAKKFQSDWSTVSIGKGILQGIGGYMGFEAIKNSFEGFLQRAAGIKELAEQLDMSAEATQKWSKAVDRLGLSFGAMQNVLTTIQQKRLEAAKDPAAAGLFSGLGISRADVLDTRGLNASDFAQRVLQSSNRGALGQLIGNRGLKYSGAAGLFDQMTPDMNQAALATATMAEVGKKQALGLMDRMYSHLLRISPLVNSLMLLGGRGGKPGNTAGSSIASTSNASIYDPLQTAVANEREKNAEKIADAQEREHEAERRNMPIAERRLSVEKEIAVVKAKIKSLDFTAPETEEQRTARLVELAGYRGKLAGLTGELREHPLNFAADNLAKVGLYGASSVSFNPVLGVAQQQLTVLHAIAHNTQAGKNHWKL